MTTVFDVARYIIDQLGDITTLKLQKLCYYCQAWALAWDGKPLFNEDFQAWANGPVCPDLFAKHKGKFVVGDDFLTDHKNYPFTDDEKETMNAVLEYYGDKEPHWLSELTHKEQPWIQARNGTPIGYPSESVITKESMQEYYGGLK